VSKVLAFAHPWPCHLVEVTWKNGKREPNQRVTDAIPGLLSRGSHVQIVPGAPHFPNKNARFRQMCASLYQVGAFSGLSKTPSKSSRFPKSLGRSHLVEDHKSVIGRASDRCGQRPGRPSFEWRFGDVWVSRNGARIAPACRNAIHGASSGLELGGSDSTVFRPVKPQNGTTRNFTIPLTDANGRSS